MIFGVIIYVPTKETKQEEITGKTKPEKVFIWVKLATSVVILIMMLFAGITFLNELPESIESNRKAIMGWAEISKINSENIQDLRDEITIANLEENAEIGLLKTAVQELSAEQKSAIRQTQEINNTLIATSTEMSTSFEFFKKSLDDMKNSVDSLE